MICFLQHKCNIEAIFLYLYMTPVVAVLCVQQCDQVHIDDVSSDDNGQDLRWDFCFLPFYCSWCRMAFIS